MNYEVGSMWRKWDLHVHSPFSILNQGDLGNAFNETKKDSVMDNYVHELFRRAIDEQIYAIGITDYFMIEGYKEVKKILGDGKRLSSIFSDEISRDIHYLDKIKNIMILPNIEFRLNLAIKEKTINGSNDSKMQIHVIFSDLLNIQKIEQNFLHLLTFAREMCDGRQTRYTLTKENLIAYGDDLKKTGVGGNENSLFVGTNNAYVILEDLLDILNTPDFLDNFIIILAEEDQSSLNWNNQLGGIRKNLYKASDAIFSSNEKTIKWGQSSDSFKILEKNLPCLWGSDAHEFNKMFKPDLNRYTWIKADTTFNGLTIALNNAPNRLFIGEFCKECESAKIRKNITIKEIKAQLKDTSNKSKVWFDIDLKLNPFLISIIGNKGSGKSALSDIIGHTANTTNSQYFSFLSENRFLSRKTKYGELYSSNLSFYDDSCVEKDNLSSPYNPTKNCLVKYLPQKYMEEICNDLNDTFQKEIDEMIFSYVPTQEKADSSSLLDLIATKTKSNLTTLFSNKSNLEKNNLEIRKLEEKSTNQYRQEIENRLNAQKRKFFEHDLNKPIEVKQPSEEFKHENSSKITTLSQMVYKIDDEITNKVKELTETNRKLNIIEEFMNSATEIKKDIECLNLDYSNFSSILELENIDFVTYKFNSEKIIDKYKTLSKNKESLSKILDDYDINNLSKEIPENVTEESKIIDYINKTPSLFIKKEILKAFINRFMSDVSLEEQKYLKYLNDFENWKLMKQMFEGTIPNIYDGESIKKYESEIEYIESKLENDLKNLYAERIKYISSIYEEYKLIITKYEAIYAPIQDKINNLVQNEKEKIEFRALLKVNKEKLKEKILSFIDTRAAGDFKTKSEANKEVESMISETDFNVFESVIALVNKLLKKTSGDRNETSKKLSNPTDFYNFITKLEFINPAFSILSGERDLSELSPGERGIVLLIFYLALSKDNLPLIIDQPEDNLDNQSVFTRLVPAINTAKKSRQIIVVTHNPNIAVACDSEQIINCSIDKISGEMKYESGSIENPKTKKQILDVLEGTKPAFEKRRTTYK